MMTILELVLLLLVACVCGSIAQALAGWSHGGCLVTTALGFIGALLGAWIARSLSLPELLEIQLGDTSFPIVWSIIGGALFVALLGLISGGRR